MSRVLSGVVYGILATIPVLFGAVQPWVWSAYTVFIFLAYALSVWQRGSRDNPGMGWAGQGVLGIFFAWSVFQIVPLPPAILKLLSPVKQANAARAFSLMGEALPWQSLSYSMRVSLAEIAFCLGLFAFYQVLTRVIREERRFKTVVTLMMMLGVAEALYGIIQALVPAVGVLWTDASSAGFGNARGTYINRNNFAGFMEMVIPVTLGFAMAVSYWPVRGKLKKILGYDRLNKSLFFAMMLVVMLLALVFSKSRAGIMGAAVAVLAFFIVSRIAMKRKSKVVWLLIGTVLCLFLVYGLSMGFGPVIERFLRIGKDNSRLDIWKDTLRLIQDHPLGVGLGNYETVFQVYHVHFNPNLRVLDAHNDYLQVLAESGWPGFVVLAGGFLYFLVQRFRRIANMNPDEDPFSFFISLGALCGLTALFFHSGFDFNLQIPANALYFVTLMALVRRGQVFTLDTQTSPQ